MTNQPRFEQAFPFQKDVLALPVTDLDAASEWYCQKFGMQEVERRSRPNPTVILERNGTRLGFSINGRDATQDGAAIRVTEIHGIREELLSKGVETTNWRVDDRDGQKFQVFFVVAPDGLCYYFHQAISKDSAE